MSIMEVKEGMGDDISKIKRSLIITVSVIIMAVAAVVASWPEQPEITGINPVVISHFKDGSPGVELQLKVYNPSNVDIGIKQLVLYVQLPESDSKLIMVPVSVNLWNEEKKILQNLNGKMTEDRSLDIGSAGSMLLNITLSSFVDSGRKFDFFTKGTFKFEMLVWTIDGKKPNFVLPFQIEVGDSVLEDLKRNFEQGTKGKRITRKFKCFGEIEGKQ